MYIISLDYQSPLTYRHHSPPSSLTTTLPPPSVHHLFTSLSPSPPEFLPIPITLLITSVFEEHSPSKTSSIKPIWLPFCSLNSYSCGSKSDNLTTSLLLTPFSGLWVILKICYAWSLPFTRVASLSMASLRSLHSQSHAAFQKQQSQGEWRDSPHWIDENG